MFALTNVQACAPPTDPAHRGFLQHCDVHALLSGTDAVDHQKGTGVPGALRTTDDAELAQS